jgi:hypothetical protein
MCRTGEVRFRLAPGSEAVLIFYCYSSLTNAAWWRHPDCLTSRSSHNVVTLYNCRYALSLVSIFHA